MKQNDDLLHNYTVAKITCDCNFNPAKIPIKSVKTIQDNDEVIDYDDKNNIKMEYQYHKNGDLILDYEYKTRFLLSDGSIISRNEYLQKKENNQIVYVACLVGCTYHCG